MQTTNARSACLAFAVRRLALVPLALASGCAVTSGGTPSPSGPRLLAEWEPAQGTLVTWPFQLPDELVVDLAEEATLYVLVAEGEDAEATARLDALQVPATSRELVRTTSQSPWTRDWGPHQVQLPGGERAFVDHVFLGYPWVPADATLDDLEYPWKEHEGDDDAAVQLAAYFGLPVVELPAIATGGNFLVDGRGRAFCTEAQVLENAPKMDEAAYRALLREVLGIEELVVLENTEERGIQHIDCWLKLLDEETLLVKRAPEDHPEHAPIERNLERLLALRAPSGEPYRIVRIDCPRYRGDRIAAYTNSLMLNGVVHVPLFGVEGDEQALETYADALPGWEVRGYPYRGWRDFDALHCRTRALFDLIEDPHGARNLDRTDDPWPLERERE
jgi:agmatine/peptidylarginine deiminase